MGIVKGVVEAEHTPVVTAQKETKIQAADALFSLGHAPRQSMTIEEHGAKLVARQKALERQLMHSRTLATILQKCVTIHQIHFQWQQDLLKVLILPRQPKAHAATTQSSRL